MELRDLSLAPPPGLVAEMISWGYVTSLLDAQLLFLAWHFFFSAGDVQGSSETFRICLGIEAGHHLSIAEKVVARYYGLTVIFGIFACLGLG